MLTKTISSVRDDVRGAKKGTTSWDVVPYGKIVATDYDSFEQALTEQLANALADEHGGDPKAAQGDAQNQISQDKSASSSGDNVYVEKTINGGYYYQYHTPSVSDSSIGGNDAINPHASFNEDDDIIHDVFKTKSNASFGMGRCYSEIYDSKQQILYLTMGVAKYRNLGEWLQNATNDKMMKAAEDGHPQAEGIWGTLGNFIGAAGNMIISIPWISAPWLGKAVGAVKEDKVTNYFYFREAMPQYYRYVNTMLSHIAVGMGLYGDSSSTGGNMSSAQSSKYQGNMPEILKYGPDIFKIMCKRASRLGVDMGTTDQIYQESGSKVAKDQDVAKDLTFGKLSELINGVQTGYSAGGNFIGFRIEKSDQASESFGNELQESALAARLNNEVEASRAREMGEMSGDGWIAKFERGTKKLSALWDKISGGNIEAIFDYMAAGNGYFDLPKQWGRSTGMGRQLNFNMKLRSRTGGDNVSIFQSIFVPMSCLLCATLPRQVGDSTYTSPFLVRAFCKGMYAIPAGIITNISINRGASEFGWTLNRLPTVVDISFTIEDLSPMLFLSMAGAGDIWRQAFANNTKLHEYLETLTGIGLKERYFSIGRMKRRVEATKLLSRNTIASPTYWGYLIGDSAIVRSIARLVNWRQYLKNNGTGAVPNN